MFHVVAAPRFLTQGASWDGFAIECNQRTAGQGRFKVPQHVLGLALGPPHTAEFAISSDKRKQLRMRPGDLQIVPANLPHWVRWDRSDFVLLLLDPDLVAESSADLVGSRSSEVVPRLQLRNPLIEQIVLALKHEAESGGSGGQLYAEALVTVLSVELLRTSVNQNLPRMQTAGQLSKAAARRIAEHIEDNLAGNISLRELARMAGMGRQYFGQAFNNTFGRPPHQYVIARRVERASQLLSETDLSIAEIAYAVGFSSQSHLTTTFHKRYGLTPRLYRLR
jgi:AraC family transcriptional regulator